MKKIAALVLALCMLLACTASLAEDKTYNVGILQLVQHPALDLATQGFKDALTEKLGDKVSFNEQNASGDSAQCVTIANSLVNDQVDLILANATPALQACVNATGDIPILGTSITSYGVALGDPDMVDANGTGINVSGTSDCAPLDQQAAMILELFPEAKKVALLYCSSEANSDYQVKAVAAYLNEKGVETKEFTFMDSNEVSSVAQLAVDYADVMYIPTDNTAATYAETIANVVLPAKMPVVTGEEGICQGCGVVTLTISYYDIGTAAGEMAYEILVNGADVSTMAIQFAPQFVKKYNAANCEALGITPPEGYVAIDAAE